MTKKMIALVLALAMTLSMTVVASANSNAGMELTGTSVPPVIPPETDPDFPAGLAKLSTGLDFGSLSFATVRDDGIAARPAVSNARIATGETLPSDTVGLRVRSSQNFTAQVTLNGFAVGAQNTFAGAELALSLGGRTIALASGEGGTVGSTGYTWSSWGTGAPNTVSIPGTMNLLAGANATTPGAPVNVAVGTGYVLNAEQLWAANYTGALTVVAGTATAPGEASAIMTWNLIAQGN